MKRTKILSAAAAVLTLIMPMTAFADFMGQTLNYQYYYPTEVSNYTNAANGNYLVDGDTEISNIVDNVGSMDISADNIFIDFSSQSGFNSSSFNGWVLTDIFDTTADIIGVSINGLTSMAGFSLANVGFDANSISVNWQSLAFNADTIVSLDVQFAEVPEPATLALFGLGLAGIGFSRRKKA